MYSKELVAMNGNFCCVDITWFCIVHFTIFRSWRGDKWSTLDNCWDISCYHMSEESVGWEKSNTVRKLSSRLCRNTPCQLKSYRKDHYSPKNLWNRFKVDRFFTQNIISSLVQTYTEVQSDTGLVYIYSQEKRRKEKMLRWNSCDSCN